MDGVLLLRSFEDDFPSLAALAEMARAVELDEDAVTVMIGSGGGDKPPSDDFWVRLSALLDSLRSKGTASIRLVMSGAGDDRPDRPSVARRIADAWQMEVTAPDGAVLIAPGGTLFVHNSGGENGWWRFAPGERPRLLGPRSPAPVWQDALARVPEKTARDCVVEQIPAGIVVRPAEALTPGAADLCFAMPVHPERPVVLVGVPWGEDVADDEVADVLAALPAAQRSQVRLAPGGGRDLLRLAQSVADILGAEVEVLTGIPLLNDQAPHSGAARPTLVDRDGQPTWRPFVSAVVCLPPGADGRQTDPRLVHSHLPVPGRNSGVQGVVQLTDRWQVAVTRAGLAMGERDGARPPIDALPVDPHTFFIEVGVPGRPLDESLLPALSQLLRELGSAVRAKATLLVRGELSAETGPADALRRLAAEYGVPGIRYVTAGAAALPFRGPRPTGPAPESPRRTGLADGPSVHTTRTTVPSVGPATASASTPRPTTSGGGVATAATSGSTRPLDEPPEPPEPPEPFESSVRERRGPRSRTAGASGMIPPTPHVVPGETRGGTSAEGAAGTPAAPDGAPGTAARVAEERDGRQLVASAGSDSSASAHPADPDTATGSGVRRAASPDVVRAAGTSQQDGFEAAGTTAAVPPASDEGAGSAPLGELTRGRTSRLPHDGEETHVTAAGTGSTEGPGAPPAAVPSALLPSAPAPSADPQGQSGPRAPRVPSPPSPPSPPEQSVLSPELPRTSAQPRTSGRRPRVAATPRVADPAQAPAPVPVPAPVSAPVPPPAPVPVPVPDPAPGHEAPVPFAPGHASSNAEREAFRELAAEMWDRHSTPVSRVLTRLPALRGQELEAARTDLVAAHAYLTASEGPLSHIELTRDLYRGEGRLLPYAACLTSALRRLPSYRGVTLRGAGPVAPAPAAEPVAGALLHVPEPVSSLALPATLPGDLPLRYAIWSVTGRKVRPLLGRQGDGTTKAYEEVVFAPGTGFRVLGGRTVRGASVVLLRELPGITTWMDGPEELSQLDRAALRRLEEALDVDLPVERSASWPERCVGPVGHE